MPGNPSRKLELDDSLADAYAARATHRFFGDWDWHEAEKDLRHALELNPNAAYIHDCYGIMLGNLGVSNLN